MLKRVRMVQLFFPPEAGGGAENQAIALATIMHEQGLEAEVIGVSPISQRPSTDLAVPLRPVGWNRAFNRSLEGRVIDYSGIRRVSQYVRYNGYLLALHRFLKSTSRPGDVVVFTFFSPFSGVGSHACAGLCPTVTEWAGELEYHEPAFRMGTLWPLGGRIRSWAMQPDQFVSHFGGGLEELAALGIPQDRLSFLPNGIDTDRFHPVADVAAARAKLGIPAEEFVIAYVAYLRPKKGHGTALEAVAGARDKGVPVRLLVVGDGEQRDVLGRRVREMGLEQHVTFCGKVADVREFLWAADIAMLLSESEGAPGSVTEAMSCGLPVITTDVGGLPDSVIPQRTGILVPVGDAAAAAAAILRMWSEPGFVRSLSHSARSFVVQERDLHAVVRKYLEILETVRERWEREQD